VGAGTVGSQLAYQCALSGLPVLLTSRSQATIDRGVANTTKLLRQILSEI